MGRNLALVDRSVSSAALRSDRVLRDGIGLSRDVFPSALAEERALPRVPTADWRAGRDRRSGDDRVLVGLSDFPSAGPGEVAVASTGETGSSASAAGSGANEATAAAAEETVGSNALTNA